MIATHTNEEREMILVVGHIVAFSLLHKPYIWGGDNPAKGVDCSGLVIEILKSMGKLPARGLDCRGSLRAF